MSPTLLPYEAETATRSRYAAAAHTPEPALCCPVGYDPRLLRIIPEEVLVRDYGCGDPTRHLRAGETVLDLGCGAGKLCFMAAQVVGPTGRVIGVDMADAMLEVARRNAPIVAERLGYANVEFRKGRIQDLALDLERLDRALQQCPIQGVDAFLRAQELADRLRAEHPLIPGASVDVVVSNCVLNLVEPADKPRLFREIFRVLRPGGRAVISDIVSDEDVPLELQKDPELWSGCISGAFREDRFLRAFEEAGFHGIRLLKREERPWRIVKGIEFRAVTVEAFKDREGPCLDCLQAVIYLGPFREVTDDEGHRFRRGDRVAVCERTFDRLRRPPYAEHFAFIEPAQPVSPLEARPFPCNGPALRHPRETKGGDCDLTTAPAGSCCEGKQDCRS